MIIIIKIFVALAILCWGSFLNSLSYRLVHNNISLFNPRSTCPNCNNKIKFYDLIPVISYILLKRKCRYCNIKISGLYIFIELLSLILFSLLFIYISSSYYIAYFVFISALIISIRTDLETLLISNLVTIYLIPLGLIFSAFHYLPIPLWYSFLGSLLGYFVLFFISKIFTYITNKNGMGLGDLHLLAFIGSFIGPFGCWASLLLGSILGSMFGIINILKNKNNLSAKIPFGPFLALGAIIYIFLEQDILNYFLCI